MSVVAPAPAPAPAAPPTAHAAHVAGQDRLIFAAVLDRLAGAAGKSRSTGEDQAQAQNPDDARHGEPTSTQADRPTALIESALSSLFAAQAAPPASGAGGAKSRDAEAPRLASAPEVETGSEDEGAPRTSTAAALQAAVGARLAGERSFLLPSVFGGAIAAPSWNGAAPESRTSASALEPPGSAEAAGGPLRMSALSPASAKPSLLDAGGVAGISTGGRTPAEASVTMQPDAHRRAPAPGPDDPTGRRRGPAAIATGGARQNAAPSPAEPSGGAGRSDGGSANAGPFDGQASNGGLFAETAVQPAAIGLMQPAPASMSPRSADAAPRPGAAPSAATEAAAPVREIDLDLSPGGLEDVTMTMRLAGDRLNVVIRAASAHTAGAIEGAREAIAERLAAIGQPLGSLIIQQTGSTDGGTSAKDSGGGGDDGRPQGQQGDPDDRRGARRGSFGF